MIENAKDIQIFQNPIWTITVAVFSNRDSFEPTENEAIYIMSFGARCKLGILSEGEATPADFLWDKLWTLTSTDFESFTTPVKKHMIFILTGWLIKKGYDVEAGLYRPGGPDQRDFPRYDESAKRNLNSSLHFIKIPDRSKKLGSILPEGTIQPEFIWERRRNDQTGDAVASKKSEAKELAERVQIISTISTLIDNGFESSAEFLMEHHDVDSEDSLDAMAISQLANPENILLFDS